MRETDHAPDMMMDRDHILNALRERILAFATLRVSRTQAEDLTQEVLVVLHEKYPRVTELTELVPLAFQVLRFKMLDAHRKSLRRGEYYQESVDDLPLADPGDDPATQLDQKQRVDRLLAAMYDRRSPDQLQESINESDRTGSHERATYVVNHDTLTAQITVDMILGR
jgi:DNA-directed RNA polymerase specialized sigma24 family protein